MKLAPPRRHPKSAAQRDRLDSQRLLIEHEEKIFINPRFPFHHSSLQCFAVESGFSLKRFFFCLTFARASVLRERLCGSSRLEKKSEKQKTV
jgi:hypothetical protein